MDNITTIPRKNCRQSNYELMRIVAMLMIIAFHLCRLYTPEVYERVFSLNQFFSIILGSWGLLGVDVFFLLSAYFSIDAKQFETEKLCNIAILTALYGLCGLAIAVKWGGQRVSAKIIIKSILGAFSGDYWYVTAYGMLYMLLPYLNKMTKSFEEKDIKKSLLVLSIIFPLFHMAFSSSPYSDFDLPFYLYFVALYLKRCPNNFFNRNARRGFIFSMLTIIGIESMNSLLGRTIIGSSIAEVRYSTLMIVAAVFMFSFFGSLQIKTNKKINQVAKYTFGVYLIHNNPKVADCIYYNFLKLDAAFKQKTYIFALLLSVIVIYIVAWCIEFARSSISAPIKRSVLYCKYQALLEKIDYFLFF